MKHIDYYLIERGILPLLTAIFESYRRHERPDSIMRVSRSSNLFNYSLTPVAAVASKAMRVWTFLERNAPASIVRMLSIASLADDPKVDASLFRSICHMVDTRCFDFSCTSTAELLWISRRLSLTANRISEQIMRRCGNGSTCAINHQADILPIIAAEMKRHASGQNFSITDPRRHYGISYVNGSFRISGLTESSSLWTSAQWPYLLCTKKIGDTTDRMVNCVAEIF
ncbi:MAG: hypothetical protein NC230_04555 [Bacteroides sp.]|nr:hypothetical protein [Bacteroides sp.]